MRHELDCSFFPFSNSFVKLKLLLQYLINWDIKSEESNMMRYPSLLVSSAPSNALALATIFWVESSSSLHIWVGYRALALSCKNFTKSLSSLLINYYVELKLWTINIQTGALALYLKKWPLSLSSLYTRS